MKQLLLLLACVLGFASSTAAQQNQFPFTLGFQPNYVENGGTQYDTLNTNTTYLAWGANLSVTKTLDQARYYCDSKVGTPDIRVALYGSSTSTGAPNTSLEEKALNPTCPGWNDWTGFTTSMTAGSQYYVIVRNAAGTPASNYAVFRRIPKLDYSVLGGNRASIGSAWGWCYRYSTDSGTTWANGNGSGGHGGMRLKFSDSTYTGIPVSNVLKDTTNQIYGAREFGAYFVVPSTWPTIKVAGISFSMGNQGTAPAELRYRLYTGSTPSLQATTNSIPDEHFQADSWIPLYFPSAITLSPNQIVRITAGAVTGGSSGNSFALQRYDWDTDANSRTLLPLSLQGSYFDGTSTWTQLPGNVPPFVLILDKAGEFAAAAGGGVINQNQASGGSQ